MAASMNDIAIKPYRLEWKPDDTRKVSEGGSLLGEGTFGSVYRGEMDGDLVAIKVIKAPRGPDGSRQSQGRRAAEEQHAREIRRLMKLRFRYVVQCYGVSRSPRSNELLIITECLTGGSLHASLESARAANATLTTDSLLKICSHIAKGLLYIHNTGFIHGDVKPHNVLLNTAVEIDARMSSAFFPGHVEAKVADFGMSKRLKSDESLNLAMSTAEFGNQPFGTYAYMAPESFHGVSNLDDEQLKAVDVFAFGVLIYELLSGMSPWKYEGVANPMQLQRLVCFEKRRPHWGTRPIRHDYKELVELCWHHDSSRRPTTLMLTKQFDSWLKEESARARQSSSSVSTVGARSEMSSVPDGHRPPSVPTHSRRPTRSPSSGDSPPTMPTTPSALRDDDAIVHVESQRISPGQSRELAGPARRVRSRDVSPAMFPPSPDEGGDYSNSSVSDLQRISTADLPSLSGSGDVVDDDVDDDGDQDDDIVDDVDGESYSADLAANGRDSKKKYWKQGTSAHNLRVSPPSENYEPGDSVANMVKPGTSQPQQPSLATVASEGSSVDGLEYSAMADAYITRVETQTFKEPERPSLELPVGLQLPGAEIFNTGPSAGPTGEVKWGDSMIQAVEGANDANAGKGNATEEEVKATPAVVALREKFEALSTDEPAGQSKPRGQGPAAEAMELPLAQNSRRRGSSVEDVHAAMGLVPDPKQLRAGGAAPTAEDRSSPDSRALFHTASSSNASQAGVPGPVQANGHAGGPGPAHGPNASQIRRQQPGYPAPQRHPTMPNQRPGPPGYPGPGASFANSSKQQLSVPDVLQALQSPDGDVRVKQMFDGGHSAVVAAALQRDESQSDVSARFKLLIDLLRKTMTAEISNKGKLKSHASSSVAKALCIALGNIFRGGLGDRGSAEAALPTTLQTMQAFTWDMNVYSAACYALANVMKVSNDISDDRVRRDVADWISHATSFNLNNKSGGPEPILAYITAAAARSFVWRREENARAFFARREAQRMVHASAAENMCKSMIYFQPDAMVVEHCLSAFAALAFFPAHRTSLVQIGVVGAAQRVMDRSSITEHEQVLTTGLAMLGILVAHSAGQSETHQIVEALINEGGVRIVISVLNDAVRVRKFRAMEEGLAALAAMARFDTRLSKHIVQFGGVSPVIQTVFCYVQGAPEQLKPRAAEVMCDVVDVLSQNMAAASKMRQTGLSQPLGTLVHKFAQEPRVVNPGRQAIQRVR